MIPIIGIGSSAGGIKELESLFKNMPNTIDAAFVIIQHLSPDYKSTLAEIVSRYTAMSVTLITDNIQIKPRNVYIIPPGQLVTLDKNKLHLTVQPEERHLHLPIDIFFSSLNKQQMRKSVAIILSGSGSDGTEGIKALKKGGGLVIVQDPSTADYDGMPQSAINTGLVDLILNVEKISDAILNYFENKQISESVINREEKDFEQQLQRILKLLAEKAGNDFTDYKRNTLIRRLERRLSDKGINNLNDYYTYLKSSVKEQKLLNKEMLISVTEFFREPDAFNYVVDHRLKDYMNSFEGDVFRVWIPACATGEEVYTWAMIIKEYFCEHKIDKKIQVFASDIDEVAIEKARLGYYESDIIANIPKYYLEKYFVAKLDGFQVKKSVREHVVFAIQNLTQDPPYSKIDLISCRNLLIYLNVTLQRKVFNTFYYSLRSNGMLVLGGAESLGQSSKYFEVISSKNKIFTKKLNVQVPREIWDFSKGTKQNIMSNGNVDSKSISEIIRDFLLVNHVPPCVVVNQHGRMVYVEGKTGKYLEISTGEVDYDLYKVLKPGLKAPVLNAVKKITNEMEELTLRKVQVNSSEKVFYADINLYPLHLGDNYLIVIVFNELIENVNSTNQKNDRLSDELIRLETDLATKEQSLQNTIEELETTNEELKSANEESQSINEELQSSNEELEMSKEGLQSLNEELRNINIELERNSDGLNKANDDINNLLRATNIATLFLDSEFNIKNFTPAINEIFGLVSTDIGRSIMRFSNNLIDVDYIESSKNVLNTLALYEQEVKTTDQFYYWMRISPYRTIDEVVVGVVITFTNITEKKQQELELLRYHNVDEINKEKTEIITQLKEANLTKDKLFSIIAHDLKRPFNQIIPFIDLMRKGIDSFTPEDTKKVLDNIFNSTKETSLLLQNLLVWAQTQINNKVVKFTQCNITEIIQNVIHRNELWLTNKQIKLNFDSNYVCILSVDKTAFDVVVGNLLNNAIKFTNLGGEIDVSINKNLETNSVDIKISDNGIGIPKSIQQTIFTIDHKNSRKGTSNEPTNGIGLVLCYDIIKQHNGTLTFESIENEGTSFNISLPSVA